MSQSEVAVAAAASGDVDIGWLDLRVVKVLDVQFHRWDPHSYIAYIDIGNRITRLCVCRLVEHYRQYDLKYDKRGGEAAPLVGLCNINHVNKSGVTSTARLLAAATRGRRELLRPPPDARPGDRVSADGFVRRLYDPIAAMHIFNRQVKPPKRKIFSAVSPELRVDGERVATYRGVPLRLTNGPRQGELIKTKRMKNCRIR